MLRWHGGKWLLAPWIISHFPEHKTYVEPFGGAASVLLRKPRAYAEVYNDLDDDVVNLFTVCRDPETAEQLVTSLELTPFARTEFDAAYALSDCPVESARRLLVRSFMGFAAKGSTGLTTGFRDNSKRRGTIPAHDWRGYPDALRLTISRLQGVIINKKPALEMIDKYDDADTLFYLDPPYLPDTRDAGADYRHEMTIEDHEELLERVMNVQGSVLISGYKSNVYDRALKEWRCDIHTSMADGARKRTEVIWKNYQKAQGDLF